MKAWLLAVAVVAGSCGGARVGGDVSPSPSASPSNASPSSTASPSPTASPSVTALTSARGFITVRQPLANARVTPPVVISGEASVFEANVEWRLTDTAGRVLAQGTTMATAGAPARGTFTIIAAFARPAGDTIVIVEVFERSPRDGSIDEIVRVPVVVTP